MIDQLNGGQEASLEESAEDLRRVCWEVEALIKEWGMAGHAGNISPKAFMEALGRPEKNVLKALLKVAQHGYLNFLLAAVCKEGEPHEIQEFQFEAVGSWEQPVFRSTDPSFLLPGRDGPLRLYCARCGKDVEIRQEDLTVWFRIPQDYLQHLAEEAQKPRRRLRLLTER